MPLVSDSWMLIGAVIMCGNLWFPQSRRAQNWCSSSRLCGSFGELTPVLISVLAFSFQIHLQRDLELREIPPSTGFTIGCEGIHFISKLKVNFFCFDTWFMCRFFYEYSKAHLQTVVILLTKVSAIAPCANWVFAVLISSFSRAPTPSVTDVTSFTVK